ncbi:phosphoribosylformylglycinamidine synthase subunit PurQ [Alphaproteobacteria bacterium]|nr:phosphoribosylformylglycinamidine synthase subunit PurQ [Alphaproteobacteria bacterium]
MTATVIVFPGSNCDRDVAVCLEAALGEAPIMAWHGDHQLPDCDAIILPGGFSYGDYLRGGSIAAQSPIMREVVSAAQKGIPVLGICNGFQILTECGLLPGVLMRNSGLKFICRDVDLTVGNTQTPFMSGYKRDQNITLPIAHNEGNYFASDETLDALEDNDLIVLRYAGENPNGASRAIAGIRNQAGNVVGMMPHPERLAEAALGGEDGRAIFDGLASFLAK